MHIKKFLDRNPDFPKFESAPVLHTLDVLVTRLNKDCAHDSDDNVVQYLNLMRTQEFFDLEEMRNGNDWKLEQRARNLAMYSAEGSQPDEALKRNETKELIGDYINLRWKEGLALTYPDKLLG